MTISGRLNGKSISPDNLKKQFLEELKANDLIGEVKSETRWKTSIILSFNTTSSQRTI